MKDPIAALAPCCCNLSLRMCHCYLLSPFCWEGAATLILAVSFVLRGCRYPYSCCSLELRCAATYYEGAAAWGRVPIPVVRVPQPVEGCRCLIKWYYWLLWGEPWSFVVYALSISAVGVSFAKGWGFVFDSLNCGGMKVLSNRDYRSLIDLN